MIDLKRTLLILSLFLLVFTISCSDKSSEPIKIDAFEAKTMLDEDPTIILVDVRTESEYESGHIASAILIPLDSLSSLAESMLPNKDTKIIIYCRSGNRSAQAVSILDDLGYTQLYDLGGIIDWPYGVVS